jgi:hypothetical protein
MATEDALAAHGVKKGPRLKVLKWAAAQGGRSSGGGGAAPAAAQPTTAGVAAPLEANLRLLLMQIGAVGADGSLGSGGVGSVDALSKCSDAELAALDVPQGARLKIAKWRLANYPSLVAADENAAEKGATEEEREEEEEEGGDEPFVDASPDAAEEDWYEVGVDEEGGAEDEAAAAPSAALVQLLTAVGVPEDAWAALAAAGITEPAALLAATDDALAAAGLKRGPRVKVTNYKKKAAAAAEDGGAPAAAAASAARDMLLKKAAAEMAAVEKAAAEAAVAAEKAAAEKATADQAAADKAVAEKAAAAAEKSAAKKERKAAAAAEKAAAEMAASEKADAEKRAKVEKKAAAEKAAAERAAAEKAAAEKAAAEKAAADKAAAVQAAAEKEAAEAAAAAAAEPAQLPETLAELLEALGFGPDPATAAALQDAGFLTIRDLNAPDPAALLDLKVKSDSRLNSKKRNKIGRWMSRHATEYPPRVEPSAQPVPELEPASSGGGDAGAAEAASAESTEAAVADAQSPEDLKLTTANALAFQDAGAVQASTATAPAAAASSSAAPQRMSSAALALLEAVDLCEEDGALAAEGLVRLKHMASDEAEALLKERGVRKGPLVKLRKEVNARAPTVDEAAEDAELVSGFRGDNGHGVGNHGGGNDSGVGNASSGGNSSAGAGGDGSAGAGSNVSGGGASGAPEGAGSDIVSSAGSRSTAATAAVAEPTDDDDLSALLAAVQAAETSEAESLDLALQLQHQFEHEDAASSAAALQANHEEVERTAKEQSDAAAEAESVAAEAVSAATATASLPPSASPASSGLFAGVKSLFSSLTGGRAAPSETGEAAFPEAPTSSLSAVAQPVPPPVAVEAPLRLGVRSQVLLPPALDGSGSNASRRGLAALEETPDEFAEVLQIKRDGAVASGVLVKMRKFDPTGSLVRQRAALVERDFATLRAVPAAARLAFRGAAAKLADELEAGNQFVSHMDATMTLLEWSAYFEGLAAQQVGLRSVVRPQIGWQHPETWGGPTAAAEGGSLMHVWGVVEVTLPPSAQASPQPTVVWHRVNEGTRLLEEKPRLGADRR